jgi:hypothetical protein
MKIALYASNHGFGHATRVSALASSLIDLGAYVYICTDRPRFLFNDLRSEYWEFKKAQIDRGVVHKENLLSDIDATKSALLKLIENREELVGRETLFLRENQIDLVIADIPFLIAEACLYAEVPVFAVSNFDWYFIYEELFRDDPDMLPVLNTIWGLYHRMNRSYLLDLGSSESVPGFKNPKSGGLIARRRKEYTDIHTRFSIGKSEKILLMMFGGEGILDIPIDKICEAWEGTVLSPYSGYTASNLKCVSADEDFLSIMHYADLVLCKPGYSTFAEVLSQGKSMVYIPRQNYPEERVLIEGVKDYPGAIMVEQFPEEVGEIRELFAQVPRGDFRKHTANTRLAGTMLNEYLKIKYPLDRIVSVFDLGSNNMNYVLFNKSQNRVIHRFWCTTGLGLGYADGKLSETSIELSLQNMAEIMDIDAAIESQKKLIATGICRKAENADEFLRHISERWNVSTKIINAKTEMKYSWRAAEDSMISGYANMVLDIGGASTEVSWLSKRGIQTGVSLDIGLLSLTEREASGENIRDVVSAEFSGLPELEKVRLIVVGLTATVLLRYIRGFSFVQTLELNGSMLSTHELSKLENNIMTQNTDEYEKLAHSAREINSMRIAAVVVQLLLDRYHSPDFVVCNDGINIGYAKWMK